MKVEE